MYIMQFCNKKYNINQAIQLTRARITGMPHSMDLKGLNQSTFKSNQQKAT